jgi:hypothetical protein
MAWRRKFDGSCGTTITGAYVALRGKLKLMKPARHVSESESVHIGMMHGRNILSYTRPQKINARKHKKREA